MKYYAMFHVNSAQLCKVHNHNRSREHFDFCFRWIRKVEMKVIDRDRFWAFNKKKLFHGYIKASFRIVGTRDKLNNGADCLVINTFPQSHRFPTLTLNRPKLCFFFDSQIVAVDSNWEIKFCCPLQQAVICCSFGRIGNRDDPIIKCK